MHVFPGNVDEFGDINQPVHGVGGNAGLHHGFYGSEVQCQLCAVKRQADAVGEFTQAGLHGEALVDVAAHGFVALIQKRHLCGWNRNSISRTEGCTRNGIRAIRCGKGDVVPTTITNVIIKEDLPIKAFKYTNFI